MAESLDFELKLIDAVTAPGKRAADALRMVEKQAQKTQAALGFHKEMSRVEQNLKKITADPKGYVALVKAQRELKESREKLLQDAGIKKPESFAAGLMSRFSFAKIAGAAAVGELVAEGAFKVAESLVEGAKRCVEIITDGVKDAFKAASHEETIRIAEKISLGADAKEFREDAERFAKKTGFDDSQVRKLMLPMRNAGLSQKASRQAFATATDIAAGRGQGGDEGAVGGILEQFKHIYTKKGIGKRQLVELLGNVGSTIPDFYKALGKQMHISAKDAEKRSEEGRLDPQMLINMITAAQNKRQGGAAGTGGEEYSKSLEDRWKRLQNLPEQYYKNLVDSPGYARASEMLGSLLEKLDPGGPTGKRIMASLDRAFTKITNALGGPDDAVDNIVAGIENMIALVADLIPDLRIVGEILAASAQLVADIILGARVSNAIAHGDFKEAKWLVEEDTKEKNRRKGRMAAEKLVRAEEQSEKNIAKARAAAALVESTVLSLPNQKAPKTVTHATTVNVNVKGSIKNARRLARELKRHTSVAERESAHWGN